MIPILATFAGAASSHSDSLEQIGQSGLGWPWQVGFILMVVVIGGAALFAVRGYFWTKLAIVIATAAATATVVKAGFGGGYRGVDGPDAYSQIGAGSAGALGYLAYGAPHNFVNQPSTLRFIWDSMSYGNSSNVEIMLNEAAAGSGYGTSGGNPSKSPTGTESDY